MSKFLYKDNLDSHCPIVRLSEVCTHRVCFLEKWFIYIIYIINKYIYYYIYKLLFKSAIKKHPLPVFCSDNRTIGQSIDKTR